MKSNDPGMYDRFKKGYFVHVKKKSAMIELIEPTIKKKADLKPKPA